jgi:hypothetical protein
MWYDLIPHRLPTGVNWNMVTKHELSPRTLIRGMATNILIVLSLFCIVAIGAGFHSAIWVDGLHIFWILGIPEPFNHTGLYGRPDHTPEDFLIHAIIDTFVLSLTISFLIVRWYTTSRNGLGMDTPLVVAPSRTKKKHTDKRQKTVVERPPPKQKPIAQPMLLAVLMLVSIAIVPIGVGYTRTSSSSTEDGLIDQHPTSPYSLSGDGDLSSDSITAFDDTSDDDSMLYPDWDSYNSTTYPDSRIGSETLSSDIPYDPDSDTNGDTSYSEWDFSESITSDIPYDPDSDTNGDTSYSEWDFSESITTDNGYFPDEDGEWDVGEWNYPYSVYQWSGDWDNNTGSVDDDMFYDDGVYLESNTGGDEVPDGTNAISFRIVAPAYIADNWQVSNIVLNYQVDCDSVSPDYHYVNFRTSTGEDMIGSTSSTFGSEITLDEDYPWDGSNDLYWTPIGTAGLKWTYIEINHYADEPDGKVIDGVKVDYLYLSWTHPDSFAESFNTTTGWAAEAGFDGTITSDNDVATITEGTDTYVRMSYEFASPQDFTNQYLEYSIVSGDTYRVSLYGGTNWFYLEGYGTNTGHKMGIITDAGGDSGFDASDVDKVTIAVSTPSGSVDIDYIRIGSIMGWQHDGCTEGVTASGGGSVASTTDTDYVQLTADGDGSSFSFAIDQTATLSNISTTYYPFLYADFHASDSADTYTLEIYNGTTYFTVQTNTTATDAHWNVAEVSSIISSFRLNVSASLVLRIDSLKLYCLNNWTFSGEGAGDLAGMDNDEECVAYYDSSEDALVMQTDFSTGNDFFRLQTRNTSIGYNLTDMVMLLTMKADTNSSCRFRLYLEGGSYDTDKYYYLFDSYATYAIPLSSSYHSVSYFWFYVWDWNSAEANDHRIYIKDNVTIRPSWYDASLETNSYGESCADMELASSWIEFGHEDAHDVTFTDGDVANFTGEYSGSGTDFDQWYDNSVSLTTVDTYFFEMRYYVDQNSSTYNFRILDFDVGGSGNFHAITLNTDGDWHTVRTLLSSISIVESIYLYWATDSAGDYFSLYVDYMRVTTAEESNGWQDGCSSVNAIPSIGADDSAGEIYTDGDILQYNDTDSNYAGIYFSPTTFISASEYSYIEFKWRADVGQQLYFYANDEDGTWGSQIALTETGDWVTTRFNIMEYLTGDYLQTISIFDGYNGYQEFWIDYVKCYSINNWTYSSSSGTLDNEYESAAYYDSSEDALVMDADFSTDADWWRIKTYNTSIGYSITDMVFGITVKCSANSSAKLRSYQVLSTGDVGTNHLLCDVYTTFWIPYSNSEATLTYFMLYIWDWNNAMADDVSIYIKNNITIRPSWHDAYVGYQENFKDVSDWSEGTWASSTPEEALFTVSNGVVSFEDNWLSGSDNDAYYSDSPSISDLDCYFEIRYKVNTTDINFLRVYFFTSDAQVGTYHYQQLDESTSWNTAEYHFSDMDATDATAIESILIIVQTTGTCNFKVEIDYIIIGSDDSVVDSYGESGATVSEWATWVDASPATDGDSLYFDVPGDNNFDRIYSNTPSFTSVTNLYYVEIRWKSNVTSSVTVYVQLYPEADHAGSGTNPIITTVANTWKINYATLTISTIESIAIIARQSTDNFRLYIDYIRIMPIQTYGWQDDCSSVNGVYNGLVEQYSDGDELHFINQQGASYVEFDMDIEVDYCSFIEFSITGVVDYDSDTSAWDLQIIGSSSNWDTGWSDVTGTYRYNVYDMGIGDVTNVRLHFDAVGNEQVWDYIKFYDIANYTFVTDASNDANSYVSVPSTGLLRLTDTFTSSSDDRLRVSFDNTTLNIDSIHGWYLKLKARTDTATATELRVIIDWASGTDEDQTKTLSTSWAWYYFQLSASATGVLNNIEFNLEDQDDTIATTHWLEINMTSIILQPIAFSNDDSASVWSKSFTEISTWVDDDGVDFECDGDLGIMHVTDDVSYYDIYTNDISITDGAYRKFEISWITNDSTATIFVRGWSLDNRGGSSYIFLTTTYGDVGGGTTITQTEYDGSVNIESIEIKCIAHTVGNPIQFSFDYIRLAPTTEMGWQHDGSTTASISPSSLATVSTDGDLITCASTGTSQTFDFYIDSTPTKSTCYEDNYQFIEINIDSVTDDGADGSVYQIWVYESDGSSQRFHTSYTNTTGVLHFNAEASGINEISYVRIWLQVAADNVVIDYVKLYSIANFTVSPHSSCDIDDILYVSSNSIISDRSGTSATGNRITLEYDPTISVSDTYNVWNLTISDLGTDQNVAYDWYHYAYVSSWIDLDQNETRGEMPTGTVTDYKILIAESMTLSAIKFWEDATDPVILDYWIVPYTPTDDDIITMTCYTTDTVGVYQVSFNAIEYPSGHSDNDYVATESSEESGLYNYTFTSLTAGYYAWKVTVEDGGNNATDILVLQVIENELSITDIVLITTATTDVQISGRSNMDASYTVYENTGSGDVSKGSGTVDEGWFSISWTKETTAGADVDIGIKFTSDTYTEWVNGTYSTASAETFELTTWDIDWQDYYTYVTWSTSYGNSTLSVYEDGGLYGSTNENNTMQYLKSTTEGNHTLDFKIAGSASDILWKNYSYTILSSLDIDIEDWNPLTSTIRITGACNAPFNYYAYREGVYNSETGTAGSDSYSFSFTIARNTSIGEHTYQIYFNSSATSSSRWFNFSDTVSETYAWMHIKLSDQSGQKVDYVLDIYVNGSLIYDPWEFYGRTDSAYEIAVYDKFGDELHNQTYNAPSSRQYNITLQVYSFKIKSWVDGKVLFNLYSSGGGSLSTWLSWDGDHEWHVFSGKTYQLRWDTDTSNIGNWGHGSHYFPALDDHCLTPSPTWYSPVGAVLIEIDEYGIANLYDHIPDSTGGGSDFTPADAEMVSDFVMESLLEEFNPFLIATGKGQLSLIIILLFGGLAYSQYFFTERAAKNRGIRPSRPRKKAKSPAPTQSSSHRTRPQSSSSQGRDHRSSSK